MKKIYIKILAQQKGLGLVEVIAALGISVVVITSLLSLTLFSLRTSTQSTLLMEGTKAANYQMELLRAHRDQITTAWDTGANNFVDSVVTCNTTTPCYVTDAFAVVQNSRRPTNAGSTQILTGFYATTEPGGTIVHITVESSWSLGAQSKNTFVYTDFTNWQLK
jgi:Tfp pilus assembly protein PilV